MLLDMQVALSRHAVLRGDSSSGNNTVPLRDGRLSIGFDPRDRNVVLNPE